MARVLVVDDARDHANVLTTLFVTLGHECRAAYDGLQGVREAAAFRPSIVFMDLDMPVMDGFEAAARLSAQPSDERPTLVALTGNPAGNLEALAKRAGFDHVLRKPAHLDDLIALAEAA